MRPGKPEVKQTNTFLATSSLLWQSESESESENESENENYSESEPQTLPGTGSL